MKFRSFCLFFLYLINLQSIFSQGVEVKYKTSLIEKFKGQDYFEFEDNILISTKTKSLYRSFLKDTVVTIESGNYTQVGDSEGILVYKELFNKKLWVNKYVTATSMIVKEENYNIKWTIVEEFKNILGYKTQAAKGSFRGRNYTVYFCSEIPFMNGPFKFDGLPGLILEVLSDDKAVKIIAKSVKFNKELSDPTYPFNTIKTSTWDEYVNSFKKLAEKMSHYNTTETGGQSSVTISNRSIEITD